MEEEQRKKEEQEALAEIQKVQEAFDTEVDAVVKVLDNASTYTHFYKFKYKIFV